MFVADDEDDDDLDEGERGGNKPSPASVNRLVSDDDEPPIATQRLTTHQVGSIAAAASAKSVTNSPDGARDDRGETPTAPCAASDQCAVPNSKQQSQQLLLATVERGE